MTESGLPQKKLAVASDHGGFALKTFLLDQLKQADMPCEDFGPSSAERCDYPDYAQKVAEAITQGKAELGILVCGTGQGVAMSANKIKGIRAGVCSDVFSARMIREHNNAQILCLGGRVIGEELAWEIVQHFLKADFSGGRHEGRVQKMTDLEK